MQQSMSISKARKNLPSLVKEVGQHGKFIPITVNGKAQAVLLGYEELMSILETARLIVSDAGNIQDHGTVQLLDREDIKVVGEPIPPEAQIEPPHSSHATYESVDSGDNHTDQEENHDGEGHDNNDNQNHDEHNHDDRNNENHDNHDENNSDNNRDDNDHQNNENHDGHNENHDNQNHEENHDENHNQENNNHHEGDNNGEHIQENQDNPQEEHHY